MDKFLDYNKFLKKKNLLLYQADAVELEAFLRHNYYTMDIRLFVYPKQSKSIRNIKKLCQRILAIIYCGMF